MKTKRYFSKIRTLGKALLLSSLLSLSMSGGLLAKTNLLVYTAVEADELRLFKKSFEKKHSDISIKWVRDSTGIITAKLLAEKRKPRADMVWGLAATSLLMLAQEDYFQGYAPKGVQKLVPNFYDRKHATPQWVGQRVWIGSICVNTILAKQYQLPTPMRWSDLLNPIYKGHVVMPNPNSSGTGFLDVSAWIQMWGEENAWNYMEGLHKNIAHYTHSGSKPCKLAGAGEFAIGISFAKRGANMISKGAPIKVIAPEEGVGWDLEAFAIVKNTKKLAAAKKFADWSVSREANVLYNREYAKVAYPGVAKPVANFPNRIVARMIDNDFEFAGNHRKQILKKWASKFSSKKTK
ncbi:MAG: putative 2-aminoethylphosphonate ABC transporter substrate-binding protein [SAR324 cluster bacterium]|uniref:Putative 2-aminoethylphosphonate ABC transporter substrate-binding protein n=1 Tax=SAR324 cluster bacterium TaxID=2024889 RepID=A0A2A4SSS7_9DELT|nr:MAG: putative 2-aminoethylphosphonate ABC transporter substrate-binding protein [SAR324 cluster bacterium]